MTEHVSPESFPDESAPQTFKPSLAAGAVVDAHDPGYSLPSDPLSRARLQDWQDHKFGIIMHWGIYTAQGLGDSWTLCRSRDEEMMLLPADFSGDDDAWEAHYKAARTSFTGQDYRPEEWAELSRKAGARYLVFTSKHHDGFNLFDTKHSDFKVTAPDVPLGRDVLKETFDSFRAEGLETGVYFSKADWNHPGYWSPAGTTVDRFHNYDAAAEPERWQTFVDFTHAQIEELLSGYGPLNVLWLDAGWVFAPFEPIDIDRLAARARELQPGILVVDREVHGPNEDYRTPEQQIPDHRPEYPWESCVTLSEHWTSLSPDEQAKDPREVVEMLVKVVARGGNLLLGVGPDPTGAVPPSIRAALEAIGTWIGVFGEALYGTRAVSEGLVPGNGLAETWEGGAREGAGATWWLTEAPAREGEPGRLNLLDLSGDAERLSVPLSRTVASVEVLGDAVLAGWRQGDDGVLAAELRPAEGADGEGEGAALGVRAVVVRFV
ncbi:MULTISPECIES: alpha-L-fucosidase [Arthrobacter]|uniref:alpha-L-fucosidase n=2 Tax=Arthrobacter TaxID=1663 RepID=A0ABU9KHF7_9MICC|nr:alpha-L-fucosidase [Arthrobacter sp. YJM1]MDP5226667.1 alpha-L-fucosidase [Arthrobacter sp. YJM1]